MAQNISILTWTSLQKNTFRITHLAPNLTTGVRSLGPNRDTLWERKGHLLRHVVIYFHQFELELEEQVAISKDVNEQLGLTSLERFSDIHDATREIQVSCCPCLSNHFRVMLIESGK